MSARARFLADMPPDHAPPRTHAALADEIRENPGLWRYVGAYASRGGAFAAASMIRTGRRRAWRARPGGHYEADARTTKRGAHEVYARWVTDTTTTGAA